MDGGDCVWGRCQIRWNKVCFDGTKSVCAFVPVSHFGRHSDRRGAKRRGRVRIPSPPGAVPIRPEKCLRTLWRTLCSPQEPMQAGCSWKLTCTIHFGGRMGNGHDHRPLAGTQTQIKTTCTDKALMEFMGLLEIEMSNRAMEDDEDRRRRRRRRSQANMAASSSQSPPDAANAAANAVGKGRRKGKGKPKSGGKGEEDSMSGVSHRQMAKR